MRFYLSTLALLWAGTFAPILLSATSIIPFANLGEATAYSECVVLARAIGPVETIENGTTFMDTKFESIECIKGLLQPGTIFSLRPFSRLTGDYKIDIAGDFKPETGKTYLLFLHQNGDFWRPVMLSYYVFKQFQEGDDAFLIPLGGNGIAVLNRPDGLPIEPLGVLQQDVFLQYLRAFSAAPKMVWDGRIGRPSLRKEDIKAFDRAVPTGCDFSLGANLSRWQDAAIPVYYDDTSNPTDWGTLFPNILSAMNDNYTGISPSDAGSKSYVPNCIGGSAYQGNFISFCNANLGGSQCALIIFEDPCNEIPDLSGCVGTMGFGGSYSSSSTHQFDGLTWDNAIYGFVIVNNGAAACLFGTDYEQMLTHELTHSYRMDHLNETDYPDQNMNPICCNAINTKDRECMNYAYPAPAPVELLSFEAQLQSERQVRLKWITQSEKDNDYFSIQRSANGTQYETIKEIASLESNTGGTYEWLDTRPMAGINYYWLSQTDFDGRVQRLAIKAVTVGKNSKLLSVNPNPVKGDALIFDLDIPSFFQGTLEVINTDGRIILSNDIVLEKGIQRMQQPIEAIPAGVYLLRLFDGRQQWTARFLKQ
ncbi:MAG: T9SS type A sorting domain-containing protein [Phycisphaerae bacterium]|nr:T9SS type A sorting domain-containing protein [Saprospiraceae bacterium]